MGAVVFIAVCAYVLRSLGSRMTAVFSAICTALVFIEVVSSFSEIFSFAGGFLDGEYAEASAVCLKVVGVGYLFGSASEIFGFIA